MPSDELGEVLEVITDLARKAAAGDYIFRGEPQCYPEVSSGLYRELPDSLRGQVEAVQEVRLLEAQRFTTERDEFEILTELQHYGGKTNLIDFTADYLIALFFACDGSPSQDGRVLLLERSAVEDYIYEPSRPVNRAIAQKSRFVRPPQGFVEPDIVVVIPAQRKAPLLRYLRQGHGIAAETIYNDLHGYIRYAAIHQEASATFSAGQARLNAGDCLGAVELFSQALALNPQLVEAYNGRGAAYQTIGEIDLALADFNQAVVLDPDYAVGYFNRGFTYRLKSEWDLAIQDLTNAINLDPDYAAAYYYRGEAWLHLGEWEQARADLVTARDLGYDIVASFHHDYETVAAFEQRHGVQLPPDIVEMLGGINPGSGAISPAR